MENTKKRKTRKEKDIPNDVKTQTNLVKRKFFFFNQ
jgi:hypothetical protein